MPRRDAIALRFALLVVITPLPLQAKTRLGEPPPAPHPDLTAERDWLLEDADYNAGVYHNDDGRALVLGNGQDSSRSRYRERISPRSVRSGCRRATRAGPRDGLIRGRISLWRD
jgi:hypothetical protein